MKRRLGLTALTVALVGGCTASPQPITPYHEGGSTPSEQVIASDDGIAGDETDWGILDPGYGPVVDKVAGMTSDAALQRAVQRRGLSLVNVMWEDTGRYQGSSVGPNITDLTLQVRYRRPGQGAETGAIMPVIRLPNFTDRTGDIPADKFFVRVGNHRAKDQLVTVPLTDVLRNVKRFASKPWSIQGDGNLLAARDSHFLVSAQAVFLPVPKQGKAEFNPVVFNYQSSPGSPAVLTILVTRQGTSMSVIDNNPEDGTVAGWGQELYFNNEGQRAAFTAERLSDVKERIAAQGGPQTADDKSAVQKGADVIFLIQVPLKHSARRVTRPRWRTPLPWPPRLQDRPNPPCAPRAATWSRRSSVTAETAGPSTRARASSSSAMRASRSASPCSSTRRPATASPARPTSTPSRDPSAASTSTPTRWARWCSPRATATA
jgi:hypothetical protein